MGGSSSKTKKTIPPPKTTLYAIEFINDSKKAQLMKQLTETLNGVISYSNANTKDVIIRRFRIELIKLEEDLKNLKGLLDYVCAGFVFDCNSIYKEKTKMDSLDINVLKKGLDDLISENCLPYKQDRCFQGAIPELNKTLEKLAQIDDNEYFMKSIKNVRDQIIMIFGKYVMLNNDIAYIKEKMAKQTKRQVKGGLDDEVLSSSLGGLSGATSTIIAITVVVIVIILCIILLAYYLGWMEKIEPYSFQNRISNNLDPQGVNSYVLGSYYYHR